MRDFSISDYKNSSILLLYSRRDEIELDPPYQRAGGVWNRETRQLLLDSILNGFDIPKFYFHEFVPPKADGTSVIHFAIIDGKQRLQTIWDFIDGKTALADDFSFLNDEAIDAKGMTYAQLGRHYPQHKALFDAYHLDIVTIRTDEIDRIEDMFSRLNEAAPLNAPEKRNAFGGPLPSKITALSEHPFFSEKVPFGNTRYRYRDLAAKALWLEHNDGLVNTKKGDLDEFVKAFKKFQQAELPEGSTESVERLVTQTAATLDVMAGAFEHNDRLLRQVGLITLYLHLYRNIRRQRIDPVGRRELEWFESRRVENRRLAENDTATHNLDRELLEFDKHSQTPNDGYALRIRLKILLDHLQVEFGTGYSADALLEEDSLARRAARQS